MAAAAQRDTRVVGDQRHTRHLAAAQRRERRRHEARIEARHAPGERVVPARLQLPSHLQDQHHPAGVLVGEHILQPPRKSAAQVLLQTPQTPHIRVRAEGAQGTRRAARALRAFGADPYVRGLWRLQEDLCRALPGRLEDVLADEHARGVVLILEVGRELQPGGHDTLTGCVARLDARFVSPALTALRRGEVASVTLIANDTRITLRRRSHLRLWRRPRAGLRSFA